MIASNGRTRRETGLHRGLNVARPAAPLLALLACLAVAGCAASGTPPVPEDQTVPVHSDDGGGGGGM